MQPIRLGVGIRELSVDLGLPKRLARHLKVADEVVVLASMVRDLNDLDEVGGIVCLDIRLYKAIRLYITTERVGREETDRWHP